MNRKRILKHLLILGGVILLGYFLWPHLERAYWTYSLGQSFDEWDSFGEEIEDADTVEVLVLDRRAKGDDPVSISGYADFHASTKVVLTGEAIKPLTEDWHFLIYSPRHTALCHGPPYGLRYLKNGKVVGEATVCWMCGNIHLQSSKAHGLYGFDPASGKWLLDELKKIAPLPERPRKIEPICHDADSDASIKSTIVPLSLFSQSMPRISPAPDATSPAITWEKLPPDIQSQTEIIGYHYGAAIIRVIYTSTASDRSSAIACVVFAYQVILPDQEMSAFPFFLLSGSDQLASVESSFDSTDSLPYALKITMTLQGNGVFWSSWTYRFEQGPVLLERTDGGRHTKETTKKYKE